LYILIRLLKIDVLKKDIERLLTNQCSNEEANAIINYLKSNPELISEYLSEDEWVNFTAGQSLQTYISKNIWNEVRKQTIQKRVSVFNLRTISVAASVLIIFISGILFLQKRDEALVKVPTNATSPIIFVSNDNKTNFIIKLSDSSIVELYPNSSISYPKYLIKT